MPIDLDAQPEAWQGLIIAVVKPTATAPVQAGFNTIREISFEQVLYGPDGYELHGPIPVTSYYEQSLNPHSDIKLEPGKYYVLIMSVGPGVLKYGDCPRYLGPIHSLLQVGSPNAQEVFDVRTIIETASLADTWLKAHKLRELQEQQMDHPLIAQYVLLARENLAKRAVEDTTNAYLTCLFNQFSTKYDPATLMLADKLLIGVGGVQGSYWATCAKRKEIFDSLATRVKPEDENFRYVQEVLKSFTAAPKQGKAEHGK